MEDLIYLQLGLFYSALTPSFKSFLTGLSIAIQPSKNKSIEDILQALVCLKHIERMVLFAGLLGLSLKFIILTNSHNNFGLLEVSGQVWRFYGFAISAPLLYCLGFNALLIEPLRHRLEKQLQK